MEKEYMSETAPVSEETEMPAVRERRARRVPQRFPSMTSAPSAPAEQETGEDTAQAVPATVPEAVQAEEIAAAAGAEEHPTEVSDADASAKTAAPDEAALLAEDAFVPLVEIPTEEPRVEQQAAAVPTAQDNSTVQKERVRRVRTYRPIVFSRKAAIIFPIVFALLITGALLWRTVGGERYEAVMLYINDREIGYIADASQADTQYARLTSELQGKTEAAFVPEVSYTCRDVVSYTDPSATALDEDEIYYAMLSNAMAGYRMGYIVEINGAAVAFVDTAETVENARRAAEEKYRERFSDALPENVRIIANESFKIVYGFGRQTDVMDEGALYSMFLTSFSSEEPLIVFSAEHEETVSEWIPYDTVIVPNDENFDGVSTAISPGYDGFAEITYLCTYDPMTGKELQRREISREVRREAVDAVAYEGHYPLPEGVSTGTFSWPLPSLPDDAPPLDANGNPIVPQNPFALKNTYISSGFGERILWGVEDFHLGYDIVAPVYTEIYACDGGVVVFAAHTSSYGYMVRIQHKDGIETLYAHQSKLAVKAGDVVQKGQLIGYVGSSGVSSGPHLHLEFRLDHVTVHPKDYIEIPAEVYNNDPNATS